MNNATIGPLAGMEPVALDPGALRNCIIRTHYRTRITVTILGLGNLSVLNVKGLDPLVVF